MFAQTLQTLKKKDSFLFKKKKLIHTTGGSVVSLLTF